ncbi:MAG: hypothetical protein RXN91_04470 [Caldivirga sp.]|jgi:hypothetical protein
MSDADPSINTGGKPGEQVKGTGEVKVEGSSARLGKGGWRCRAGMTVSVCGPVERVRVRGVGGTLTAPKVRFKISDPVSKREVDVRIALHKKSNRVIVTASWIEDGVVKAIKAKPANVKELNEFLHKYVFKRLVNNQKRFRDFNRDMAPVRRAFARIAQVGFSRRLLNSRRRVASPVELGSFNDLYERALISKPVRICLSGFRYANGGKECDENVLIIPNGDTVIIHYVKGDLDKAYKVPVLDVEVGELPSRIAIIYDPYQDNTYLVTFLNRRLVSVTSLKDAAGGELLKPVLREPAAYIVTSIKGELIVSKLRAYLAHTRYFKVPITVGIWPNYGFIDPYGIIDGENHGLRSIVDAVKWIDKYYPENHSVAKANLVYFLVKFLTPAVKAVKTQFVDKVIINISLGGVGVSTLFREIFVKGLIGINPGDEQYITVITGSVKTEPQYRNLIARNAFPLILDEQKLRDIENNKHIIHSSAVGLNIVSVHAAQYGEGFGAIFKSLRGVFINTNARRDEIIRALGTEESPFAYLRRLRFLEWKGGKTAQLEGKLAYADLPKLQPIIGFLAYLMVNHWDDLSKAGTFDELAHIVLSLIRKEANGDQEVINAINELEEAIREVEAEEEAAFERYFSNETDVTVFMSMLRGIAIALKRPTDTPNLILTLLELDAQYGVVYSKDTRVDMEDVKRNIEDLFNKFGIDGSLSDIARANSGPWGEVARRLLSLLDDGKVRVAIANGSSLIGGRRDIFLGKTPSKLRSLGGKEGFSFTLDEIIDIIVKANTTDIDEGEGQPGEGGNE